MRIAYQQPLRTFYKPVSAILACALLLLSACDTAPDQDEFIPTPRPAIIVVTASGPYYEPFDSSGSWLVGETEHSVGQIEDGRYRLTVNEKSYVAWTHQERSFGEGVYSVDTHFVSGAEGSSFGLIFLAETDLSSFFYAMITADGHYDIGYCEDFCNEQGSLIGGFTFAYTILEGDSTNHLQISIANGDLTFSVNGAPVSQLQGLQREKGVVGLIGETSPYGGLDVFFDNLSVSEASSP